MKIGVDLTFVRPDYKNGGTEAALKNLIKGIEEVRAKDKYANLEFEYFIHKSVYHEYKNRFPNLHYFVYDMRGKHALRMILFQTFVLPKLVKQEHIDVLYFPTFQTGLTKKWPVKIILNPNDIQFCYYPEYFSAGKRLYYKVFYKNALEKSDAIIAISKYVAECYKEHFFKETKDKLYQIYAAIDFDNALPEKMPENLSAENSPYILCINSILKHKNIITLVKAFELLKKKDIKLVLAGASFNDSGVIEKYVKEHDLGGSVNMIGRVKDDELQYLYHHAKLFVTPSLYEGFGMTPIEAMAAKCPVISSKETSLYEVTQGLVYYYEPATDEYQLAKAMEELIDSIDRHEIENMYLEELKNRVYECYDKEKIAQQFLDLCMSFK